MCFGMFTSIPCPYRPWDEDARGLMTAMLPLVGAVIGGLWYALSILVGMFLPDMLRAALIAVLPCLLTGFMHLDGFMDTTDAVLSWRPQEERQKILKDVHCGSFAVVGVVILMLAMFAAACDAGSKSLHPLLLIPVVSRCMSAFCVSALPAIGHSEYAGMKRGDATPLIAVCLLVFSFVLGGLAMGYRCILALAFTFAGYALAMARARKSLGGVSGDLAGYSLCIGELCGLIALAVF